MPSRHPSRILWLSEKPGFRKVSLKSIMITYRWLSTFFSTDRNLDYTVSTVQIVDNTVNVGPCLRTRPLVFCHHGHLEKNDLQSRSPAGSITIPTSVHAYDFTWWAVFSLQLCTKFHTSHAAISKVDFLTNWLLNVNVQYKYYNTLASLKWICV